MFSRFLSFLLAFTALILSAVPAMAAGGNNGVQIQIWTNSPIEAGEELKIKIFASDPSGPLSEVDGEICLDTCHPIKLNTTGGIIWSTTVSDAGVFTGWVSIGKISQKFDYEVLAGEPQSVEIKSYTLIAGQSPQFEGVLVDAYGNLTKGGKSCCSIGGRVNRV